MGAAVCALLVAGCGASADSEVGSPIPSTVATRDRGAIRGLPADTPVDYQIGADYEPAADVGVVVRDWFAGEPLERGYSICYVNAFQTQPDDDGSRPDELSRWPADLILVELGDDPNWTGEYLVDISTAELRARAVEHVAPMVDACAAQGFDAVEYDNLDSWTRFDDSPVADRPPFGREEAVAYAVDLVDLAHERGLAVGQKNAVEIAGSEARERIGFDFAVVEECGRFGECLDVAETHGSAMVVVEYTQAGFEAACDAVGDRVSVALRDLDVSTPDDAGYVYDEC